MRHLLVIAAALAVLPTASAKTDKTQEDCGVDALRKYTVAHLALMRGQELGSTVDGIVAQRRLMEAYCVQFVRCLNTPEIVFGAEFSKCLDDEEEQHLKDRN